MRTTAEHRHRDGTVCWYDDATGWITQDRDTINVPCPGGRKGGRVVEESGDPKMVLLDADAAEAQIERIRQRHHGGPKA